MKAGAFPWHACYACDGWPVGPSSLPHLRTPTTPRPQAKKKEAHEKKKKGLSTERHNPRAFSVANIRRTQKNVQRNLDRAQRCVRSVVHGMNGGCTHTSDSIRPSIQNPNRKEHVPLVDRAEELPRLVKHPHVSREASWHRNVKPEVGFPVVEQSIYWEVRACGVM